MAPGRRAGGAGAPLGSGAGPAPRPRELGTREVYLSLCFGIFFGVPFFFKLIYFFCWCPRLSLGLRPSLCQLALAEQMGRFCHCGKDRGWKRGSVLTRFSLLLLLLALEGVYPHVCHGRVAQTHGVISEIPQGWEIWLWLRVPKRPGRTSAPELLRGGGGGRKFLCAFSSSEFF